MHDRLSLPRPDLDLTSIGQGWGSTGKRKLLGETKGFYASLDLTSIGQGKPVDRFPKRLSRLSIASTEWAFWPWKPILFYFFLFQYLGKVFRWVNMPILKNKPSFLRCMKRYEHPKCTHAIILHSFPMITSLPNDLDPVFVWSLMNFWDYAWDS